MSASFDVVSFGEVLWDIFDAESRGDEPIGRVLRREIGGAPANLAVGIARLGLKSAVVGGIGDDAFGKAIAKDLAANGVDTSFLIKFPNRTGITFVSRDEKGEPSFLFYRHDSADMAVREKQITGAMGKTKFGVAGTSTMMTPDLEKATDKFISEVEKNKGLVVVDLNIRAHLWSDEKAMKAKAAALVARADVVKASEGDLEALAGKRGISWLEQNAKGATWVLTRGENGAAAVGEHGQATAPTKRVRCIDATGAGDAFLAGVLAVLVASKAKKGDASWKDAKMWTRALEVGHIMGAKAVGAVGAVTGLSKLDDAASKLKVARGK